MSEANLASYSVLFSKLIDLFAEARWNGDITEAEHNWLLAQLRTLPEQSTEAGRLGDAVYRSARAAAALPIKTARRLRQGT
jgi:hypothetical protein